MSTTKTFYVRDIKTSRDFSYKIVAPPAPKYISDQSSQPDGQIQVETFGGLDPMTPNQNIINPPTVVFVLTGAIE